MFPRVTRSFGRTQCGYCSTSIQKHKIHTCKQLHVVSIMVSHQSIHNYGKLSPPQYKGTRSQLITPDTHTYTIHVRTLFFNDVNGYVYEVLELKVSLILRVHRSDVQRKVLWKSKNYVRSVRTHEMYDMHICLIGYTYPNQAKCRAINGT